MQKRRDGDYLLAKEGLNTVYCCTRTIAFSCAGGGGPTAQAVPCLRMVEQSKTVSAEQTQVGRRCVVVVVFERYLL